MAAHDLAKVDTSHASPRPLQTGTTPYSSGSADLSHSPRTPASPFLHNLHHRFRTGSNASSMSSDATASHAQAVPQSPAERAEAAQSAKRFLQSIVRNDWDWPNNPQCDTTEESVQKNEILAARDPIAWRTRFEGQSDIDNDSDNQMKNKKRKTSDPYRFENPDAISAAMTERKLKRKRRVEAEMEWNEGLNLWSYRRDAWTGAVPSIPRKRSSMEGKNDHTTILSPVVTEARTSQSTEDSTRAVVNGATPTWPLTQPAEETLSVIAPESDTAISTEPGLVQSTASALAAQPVPPVPSNTDVDSPYLPIYPPLFPTSHTLRAHIRPTAYPTIYSKIVVQSLTPNIPIPLTHMIGSLVDGWKSEGNWPPQAAVEPLSNKKAGRKSGTSAFSRWRRDQDGRKRHVSKRHMDEQVSSRVMSNGHSVGNELGGDGEPIDDDGKRGFRRSLTGAVKKVLGMHGEEEEETDGGLERLGIKFSEEPEEGNGEFRTAAERENAIRNGLVLEERW